MSDVRLSFNQISKLVFAWAEILGLGGWDIGVRVAELSEPDHMMEVHRAPDYDRAHVTIAPFMVKGNEAPRGFYNAIDGEYTERCVVHELLHCHFRDLKRIGLDFTEDHLHRDVHTLLEESWMHAEEATVDRLANALAYNFSQLPAKKAKKKTKKKA